MTSRVWDRYLSERDRAVAAAAGLGSRAGYGTRPALLVIDVTVNFCGDRPEPILDSIRRWRNSCGEAAWNALPAIAQLLTTARSAGVPVIYSAGLDTPPDPVYSGRWLDKNNRRAEDTTPTRAGGNEIVEPIAPQDGDIVIRKTKPSVFHGTPLLSYLIDLQIDTLVCCGVATSGCVRSTVLDAFCHNFRVAVVEEATFDRIEVSHAIALFDIEQKYGDVVSLADATRYLSQPTGTGGLRDEVRCSAAPLRPYREP